MKNCAADDERWMSRALELAARGRGRVEPNPPVGAVVVRDGEPAGEGWHEVFGGPHGEIRAIESAGRKCRGATLYVTLAPCTGNRKKTPPCCDAVIEAGFARVVIGALDPTQETAVTALEAAGMKVTTGVLEKECRRLIAPFLKLKQRGMPWVIAKWAMTADGKIATAGGDSRWISSGESRELAHRWRNEVDAVMVGAGTARRDDPLLTCRIEGGRNPRRVIVDSQAALSPESRLVKSAGEAPVILACLESAPEDRRRHLERRGVQVLRCPERGGRVDLDAVLKALGGQNITNLLVEGGTGILGELFDRRFVDEVRIFIAPRLLGGTEAPGAVGGVGVRALTDAHALTNVKWRQSGEDMLLTGDVVWKEER